MGIPKDTILLIFSAYIPALYGSKFMNFSFSLYSPEFPEILLALGLATEFHNLSPLGRLICGPQYQNGRLLFKQTCFLSFGCQEGIAAKPLTEKVFNALITNEQSTYIRI